MPPLEFCDTRKDFAEYYGCDETRIKRLAMAGANLHDEDEIAALADSRDMAGDLAEYRRLKAAPVAPTGTGKADTSLEAVLVRLREAEAILYDEFKAASRAERARAQKSWLSMQAARLKAEIDVHEAERLRSESLPVDEVKALWASALQSYRNELEAIPSKWAVFLFEKEQWQVEEELKRLSTELIAKHLTA